MSRIIAFIHLTLDGVMQAPGRPDEDRRGGFEHGGWAMPYNDGVMGKAVGESMGNTGALLQSLLRCSLVDELMLTIHPLMLGAGRRLFSDVGPSAKLRLVDSSTTTKGVVIATYQPEAIARRAA